MRWLAQGIGWLFAIFLLLVSVERELTGGLPVYLAATALVGLVVTLVHEAGHALVAKQLGARLVTFAVGSLQFDFASRTWHRQHQRNRELGGFVAYDLPEHLETSRKHLLIAVAGPAANLLFAVMAALLLALSPSSFEGGSTPVIVPSSSASPAGIKSPPIQIPDSEAITRGLEEWRARRRQQALLHNAETLIILLVLASLGAALVNLVPFDESDGAVIKAHWGR